MKATVHSTIDQHCDVENLPLRLSVAGSVLRLRCFAGGELLDDLRDGLFRTTVKNIQLTVNFRKGILFGKLSQIIARSRTGTGS